MNTYKITLAGVERDLPIVPINDDISIAAFVIFGDTDIVEPCAKALVDRLPDDVDLLFTSEAKSIPLIYEMAKIMKMPQYVIARKSVKGYMSNPITTTVKSITTAIDQILCLDQHEIDMMKGKKIAIIDDVISTGGSLTALEYLAQKAGGTVVAKAAILAEGDAAKRDDIIYLETIPIIPNK